MRALDFVSRSPQLSIFKEGANKTKFGGVIFLIYIIILITLAIIYLYDYIARDKYEFNFVIVKKPYNQLDEERQNNYVDPNLNIEIEFSPRLLIDSEYLRSPNFLVVDVKKLEDYVRAKEYIIKPNDEIIIKKNESSIRKLNDIQLAVLYKCNGNDCSIRKEDKVNGTQVYIMNFDYQGFSLQHQNPNKPLIKLEKFRNWRYGFLFSENATLIYLKWRKIVYEEEKGIFGRAYDKITGKNSTYYGGEFSEVILFPDDGHMKIVPQALNLKDEEGNTFIMLLYLRVNTDNSQYDKYTRKEISIFDVLANIAALASTTLNLMTLAYGFLYSVNYDNYKIVENILSEKMRFNINYNKNPEDELEKIELNSDLIEPSEENENNNKKIKNIEIGEGGGENIIKNLDLPSPNFFDFLIHKIYFKCFGHSKKQAIIESCNNMVSKYITIESIIYNQIRLDNLLKDYKWNNPQYESNQKDEFILGLKEK